MLLSAVVSRGMVVLAPALAAMLGADLGTTLVVQLLAFDIAALSPVLIAVGVLLAQIASGNRLRQVGHMVLGLGLMLLALELIVAASEPMRESEVMRLVLQRLAGDPILAFLVATALTWLFHSSVAFVLFVMSLAGAGAIGLPLALILVLGANLGAGLIPIGLTVGSSAPARRVLHGNLAFRAAGAFLGLAMLGELVPAAGALPGDAARQVAHVHTLFNAALLVLCLPLTGPAARLFERVLPERGPAEGAHPRRLDPGLLDRPTLALNAATRELLGMADTLETMLRETALILETADEPRIDHVRAMEQSVDAAQEALQAYLVRLLRAPLSPEQRARTVELLLFATDLEHAGDIIDKGLLRAAQKKQRLGADFSPEGWRDLNAYHARVLDQLRLALTVLVGRDLETARELVAEKDRLRALETEATERHLVRLREGTASSVATSGLHLKQRNRDGAVGCGTVSVPGQPA